MKTIAIVYFAHDGFSSQYTGVGTIARDFMFCSIELRQTLLRSLFTCEITYIYATIKYRQGCFGYSETLRNATIQFVNEHKGLRYVELLNNSGGAYSYGTLGNWQAASVSAATLLSFLSQEFDYVVAICSDTPFAQVAKRLFGHFDLSNVVIVWVPQSTALAHHSAYMSPPDPARFEERLQWEAAAVEFTNVHPQAFLGSIGPFMGRHLVEEYSAVNEKIVGVSNALYLRRLSRNIKSQAEIAQTLSKYAIPIDKPLLFSFGRCEHYKGLDLVVDNASELVDRHGFFVLILCSPRSKNMPYSEHLQLSAAALGNNVRLIFELDFELPHEIMQWHNTRILALLSREEPFGIIPIEARSYGNPYMSLVVSEVGGLQDQVQDGVDGFLTKLDSLSIRSVFRRAVNISSTKRRLMASTGQRLVRSNYDFVSVYAEFLRRLILHDAGWSN
jgi:glycosyltransferase involved in cell wall biosynthesis